jgi:putative adhesin
MKGDQRVVPLLFSVLFSVPLTALSATSIDTFHWSGHVTAGQRIEVRGINGSIHAQPAAGESVEVIAYQSGRSVDPASVGVQVVEKDGGITIFAVPQGASRACSEAGPAQDEGDVNLDFTVSVPAGVHFVARTVNGRVEAQSLHADTEAHTVNGDVVLSTTGAAQGDTVNGSITASVGKVTTPLKFSTVNGAISLEMPRGSAARIHANTQNGPIHSEFPLVTGGQFPAQHADGKIGRGGPEVKIATVNGSISVRRSKRFTKL